MKKRDMLFWGICLGIILVTIFSVNISFSLRKPTKVSIIKDEKKVAYITFDDGPSVLTEKYLDILKEKKVKATFFLIGQQIEGELIDIVKREKSEGHEIGLHSFCHEAEVIYGSKEAYRDDLLRANRRVMKYVKAKPKLYRFPWGSANSYISSFRDEFIEDMQKKGYMYQDWNVSGEDSVGCPSVDSILYQFRKDYKKYNEPVILLHDSGSCKATLEALPTIIEELKREGYSFDVLSNRTKPCHFYSYKDN